MGYELEEVNREMNSSWGPLVKGGQGKGMDNTPRAPLALIALLGWPSFTYFTGKDTEALGWGREVKETQDIALICGTQNPALLQMWWGTL